MAGTKIKQGDKVRLTEEARANIFKNSRAHWREFRHATGIVEELMNWGSGKEPGPEVNVRWHWGICDPHVSQPTYRDNELGLRYAYDPTYLEIVKT